MCRCVITRERRIRGRRGKEMETVRREADSDGGDRRVCRAWPSRPRSALRYTPASTGDSRGKAGEEPERASWRRVERNSERGESGCAVARGDVRVHAQEEPPIDARQSSRPLPFTGAATAEERKDAVADQLDPKVGMDVPPHPAASSLSRSFCSDRSSSSRSARPHQLRLNILRVRSGSRSL